VSLNITKAAPHAERTLECPCGTKLYKRIYKRIFKRISEFKLARLLPEETQFLCMC